MSIIISIVACMVPVSIAAADSDLSITDQFISEVNQSISVDSNDITISDDEIRDYVSTHQTAFFQETGESPDLLAERLIGIVNKAKKQLTTGQFVIDQNGRMIDLHETSTTLSLKAVESPKTEFFWWGVRRTYYTDAGARDYAYQLDRAAAISTAAGITALLFPGMTAPTLASAAYAIAVASSVRWAADQPGAGIVLDTTYVLTYTCNPRR